MDLKEYFTRQNFFLGLVLIAVFIFGFTTTYYTLTLSKVFVKAPLPTSTPIAQQQQLNFAPAPEITKEKGVYNTVLLGYGGEGHEGSLLTDGIIAIQINTNKKTAALISIPRDLWVTGNRKINAEASANGFQNVGGVIKSVTGLPTDYFVAVDFGGFVKLIDNLGGISVNVPKAFDDPFYPIAGLENETCGKTEEEIAVLKSKYSDHLLETQFTCRYEQLHFVKGQTNLDGTTALKFVRSRHGDSDFGRSERQFSVLRGILAKLISLRSFEKTSSTIDTLSKIVKTNVTPKVARDLIEVIGPSDQYKVTDIHLTLDNVLNEGKSAQGAYILYPKAGMLDFTQIKNFIANQL